MLIVDSSLHGHLVYVYPFFNAELGLARQLASPCSEISNEDLQ